MASEKTKKAIVEAFMALLGEKRFEAVGLGEIAERAGLSLADLRDAFDGKISILADFVRRTDRAVLDGIDPPAAEESARDRLFDIVMRRFDHLAPYKAALGSLDASLRRDPALALCLNKIALDSARFMLAAAGVGTGGLLGATRAQGYVLMLAKVLPVWRDDADPDQSRTMAALDRALESAESWSRRSDRLASLACSLASRIEKRRASRRGAPKPESDAAAA
ncbi:TetR family transcriptional regulator [Kaistia algarum]|uniref:TetR family transcriptional regulator n=1 Tax=Kaistia algarum TaxID=2083279 RepID=UPI000CE8797F|nr:TetR family transcriptional regulator [Kaistia algarum]MCX5513072.1 TetR/AcrR family transcriptional regulator [Kaistia algarum]PPE81451.1 TetR family transcriptional regulator [Kaistia algarum]